MLTQLCFGPVTIGKAAPVLDDTTGAFLKQWGVVALDFESQEGIWAKHRPKDADVMMVEQAAVMKKMAPKTQVGTSPAVSWQPTSALLLQLIGDGRMTTRVCPSAVFH